MNDFGFLWIHGRNLKQSRVSYSFDSSSHSYSDSCYSPISSLLLSITELKDWFESYSHTQCSSDCPHQNLVLLVKLAHRLPIRYEMRTAYSYFAIKNK